MKTYKVWIHIEEHDDETDEYTDKYEGSDLPFDLGEYDSHEEAMEVVDSIMEGSQTHIVDDEGMIQ